HTVVQRMNRALGRASVWIAVFTLARVALAAAPIASFIRNPTSGNAPLLVNFNASASFDTNGGTITQYDWDFGDGQQALGMVVPTVSHTFSAVGTYTTVLTITTSGGFQASTSLGTVVFLITPAGLKMANASAAAGTDIALDMIFTPSPDIGIAGFQFDLTLPTSISYVSTVLGP